MVLEYVRETYQVPAYVGGRVRYTGGKEPMEGTITGERAGHIRVRFDGQKRAYNFHPKWEMEYLLPAQERSNGLPLPRSDCALSSLRGNSQHGPQMSLNRGT